ncbi:MAG: hypothetical protein ACRCW9_06440 [Cetobacterium sp.]
MKKQIPIEYSFFNLKASDLTETINQLNQKDLRVITITPIYNKEELCHDVLFLCEEF